MLAHSVTRFLSALCCLGAAVAVHAQAPGEADRAEALDIYRHIIAMDTSVEGRQVPAMAEYLAGRFRAAGFDEADIHIVPVGDTASLIVRFRGDGSGGRPILLLSHMDVVPAHRDDWQRDPFTLVEEDGYFFGRGTVDVKNGVALLTATLLQLRAAHFVPTRDLILYFSGDEETTGVATQTVLREHRDLVDAEFALNSDGGGGSLSEDGAPEVYVLQAAEKTFASFTLTARNPGGHSSQPRPDNAIYDIADALLRIRRYAFPVMWNDTTIASLRAAGPTTPAPYGPAMTRFAQHPGDRSAAAILSSSPFYVGQVRTTCVPTLIKGGHADNALPQSVVATVNCRIFPSATAIGDVQAQLRRLAGADISVEPLGQYTSSDASPLRADVVAAVTAAVQARYPGLSVIPGMSAGATDGVFFRAAGIPTFGVGEVFIRNSDDYAHGLNERLPVESFYGGLTHWRVLINELAGRR